MKTGTDALGTAEEESGHAKHKMRPDALRTVEIDSGSAKHENETRRPRNRRKRVWERKTRKRDPTHSTPPKSSLLAHNMKTGPGALGTGEN
jgi:hypothetical protein